MNRHVDEVAALSKAIDTMLDSVTTNGSWNDYDESWAPVITALNVDLLLKAGLHPKENWTIPEKGHEQSLTASFQYLNSEIKENGTFGTDFWDACNLGLIIENHSLHHYLPSYKLLKSHILSVIKQSEIESGDSEWRGPGFIACAINYLDRLGMLTEAEVLTNKLLACQNNDGGWKGIENKSGHPIVPPVWHTSQSIITLFMRGQHQYRENIEKAVDWLKSQQEDNGSWTAVHQYDIYCTSYAMISLIQSGMANKRVIDNGVEYLKGNMSDKGRCPDMGGTVMCSLALFDYINKYNPRSEPIIRHVLLLRSLKRVEELEQKLLRTTDKIKWQEEKIFEYQDKYDGTEIILTKRDMFIFSAICLLFTILGIVIGILALG